MHVQHGHTLGHYGLFMKTSSWGHRPRVHRIEIHDATWVLYELQAGWFLFRVITIRFVHKITPKYHNMLNYYVIKEHGIFHLTSH
jgi:hypothetical protein